jgi:hypothetical protein
MSLLPKPKRKPSDASIQLQGNVPPGFIPTQRSYPRSLCGLVLAFITVAFLIYVQQGNQTPSSMETSDSKLESSLENRTFNAVSNLKTTSEIQSHPTALVKNTLTSVANPVALKDEAEVLVVKRGKYWANLAIDPFVTLLVVVPSTGSAEETNYRKVVRETWGRRIVERTHSTPHLPRGKARGMLLFFFGTKGFTRDRIEELEAENDIHKDIVFFKDFEDSYVNLSAKMILIHEWFQDNKESWPSMRMILKTDTDVWFNVPKMMHLVDQYGTRKTMVGYRYANNARLVSGKFANLEYSGRFYPQYMAGAGYLLTPDISEFVVTNYRSGWFHPMPNEDAMLGIWISGTDVKFVHSPHFKPLIEYVKITHMPKWLCHDNDILFHHLSAEGIRSLEHWFSTCGSPCSATCKSLKLQSVGKQDQKR